MIHRLVRAALRLVPADWRDDVGRDLLDGRPRPLSALHILAESLAIGARLRTARAIDRLTSRSRQRSILWRSPVRDIVQDFAASVRGTLRRPAYSLAIVATLAIGIGANTAIFSVFNWILFRPLPGVEHAEALARIRFHAGSSAGSYFISFRDFADLRGSLTQSVVGLAASVPGKLEMTAGASSATVDAEVVTSSYFDVLGARLARGRGFTAEEEAVGGPASVVISHRLGRMLFDEDAAGLGRTLVLNGRSFAVVGVASPTFQGRSMITATDVWLPISSHAALLPPAEARVFLSRGQTFTLDVIARLRPGVSLERAQSEATAAVAALPDFANRSRRTGPRASIGPVVYAGLGHDTSVVERLTPIFWLLMGAVGLLLLLACANAANLLLARAAARRREIAVCQAIGASRLRIVRQQLAEGLFLSLAAGAAGVALAVGMTRLFDGMRIVAYLPAVSGVGVDWRVALFALGVSILTGLVFATAPAIASSRVELLLALKDGGGASAGRRRRLLRTTLVTLQVAVSALLLVGAALFVRTLQNIRGLDLGVQPDGVVSFGIQPSRFGKSRTESSRYVLALLDELRNSPGITHAAFAWTTSFSSNRNDGTYRRREAPQRSISAAHAAVSRDFFATMQLPLLAGRDFTDADAQRPKGAAHAVVISRKLAEALFPDGGAVGSQLIEGEDANEPFEVIGVVEDVRGRAVTQDPEPWVYSPTATPAWGTMHVRSPLPAAQVIATIRNVARRLDPVVAPHEIETFNATVDRALSEPRLFARVSTIFAVVAGLLAGIGIYSMMAGAVAERRKEFGIRLALGARSTSVATLVVRSSSATAAAGLALGLASAAALGRIVESRLFGVSRLDPVSLAATAGAIATLTILASLAPALRAARVDPVQSLRAE